MIHAASREALATLRPETDSVISRFSAEDGFTGLADELYAVAGLLEAQPRLRRMLADPAATASARVALAESLIGGKVGASASQVVTAAVGLRWSSAWDLLDAIETTADDVLLAAAEKAGVIETVEDELFRLERILDVESALTTLIDEAAADVTRRQNLLESVVAGKVHALTSALLRHAVASGRKRSILLALDDLVEAAAARRERSIARVITAVELDANQQRALEGRLSSLYGRRIDVRYTIDPSIRGGLVVRVGDEVIDGSISARLTQARDAFAS
ncbi:F0F1 ATP synthase subunit delta [Jatrophihabitans sp.]|uniref:F0F1 ATP synthase subunit delta n=1 Tax=Jatrophihabitans sp. TaxID=1932789 RepID=UPI0030C6C6D3|nr:atpH [Jatrophihabitans sp.]